MATPCKNLRGIAFVAIFWSGRTRPSSSLDIDRSCWYRGDCPTIWIYSAAFTSKKKTFRWPSIRLVRSFTSTRWMSDFTQIPILSYQSPWAIIPDIDNLMRRRRRQQNPIYVTWADNRHFTTQLRRRIHPRSHVVGRWHVILSLASGLRWYQVHCHYSIDVGRKAYSKIAYRIGCALRSHERWESIVGCSDMMEPGGCLLYAIQTYSRAGR